MTLQGTKLANTTTHKSLLVQRHSLLCPSKELTDLVWAFSTGVEQMGTWADSLGTGNLPAPETPCLGEESSARLTTSCPRASFGQEPRPTLR